MSKNVETNKKQTNKHEDIDAMVNSLWFVLILVLNFIQNTYKSILEEYFQSLLTQTTSCEDVLALLQKYQSLDLPFLLVFSKISFLIKYFVRL